MIVHARFEVSDEVRAALRKRQGRSGVATRGEILQELDRLWEAFVEKAEEPVPLDGPELPKHEHRALDLALFTTETLQAEVAARLRWKEEV